MTAGFSVVFLARLAMGVALFVIAVQWDHHSQSVAGRDTAIERLEQLSLDTEAAESYARRFAENRDLLDLTRCREALGRAAAQERSLESLFADSRAERKAMVQIRRLGALQADTILGSPGSGAAPDPASVKAALESLDKAAFDLDYRAAIADVEGAERRAMRDGMAWQQKNAEFSRLLVLVASVCSLSLIFFAGWRILADQKARDAIEKKLAAKEEQYRKVVELAGDFIYRTDERGRVTFCNEAALSSLHFSKSETIGRTYLKLVRQDKRRATERFYARQLVRRQPNTYYEFPIIDGHGHERWVGQNVQLVFEDGRVAGFQAIAREITQRKRAEYELQKSRLFVERIAATTPGILYVYDLIERRNVYNNREVLTVLGYKPEEMQNMADVVQVLVHPDDQQLLLTHYEALRHARDGEVRRTEYRARHADGYWVWMSARDTAFERGHDGLVRQVVGISQDISAPKAIQEKLVYQANYDALSGLSNRHHFFTGLQTALRRASIEMSSIALCLFDVDHFKKINDRFGHAAGDEVLEAIGGIVRAELGSTELAGRLGGDEFCFALPGTDRNECARVAERIRERLGTLAFGMASGSPFSVTATFGVAESEQDMDAKGMMEAADRALYRAKAAGRNRVVAEA